MKKKILAAVITLTLALTTLAGCGNSSAASESTSVSETVKEVTSEATGDSATESGEEATGTETKSVTVYAINDPQMSAAHYVALDQGFYDEAGLEVKTEVVASGPDLASFVASGDDKIAMGTTYNLFSWLENGVTMKAVAPLVNMGGTQCVVARPGLEITEENVKDLEGAKIGMVSGAEVYLAINKMCEKYGLDKDSFQYINLSTAEQVAALSSGDIDMMAAWEPFVTNACADGGTLLFSGTKNFIADPENGEDVNWCRLYNCLMASEDVIAEKSDELSRMMVALDKATEFINSNREDAIKILAPIYEMDEDVLRSVMEKNVYTMDVDNDFVEATAVVSSFAVEQGTTTTEFTMEQYGDFGILKETIPEKVTAE